jgi:glycosyltransferase involved in cell wall biosynthesis
MKIIQINAVYEYSSTGRTTTEMHRALQKDGYESYVFCANCHKPDINVYQMGNKLEHKIHAFLGRLLGMQGVFSVIPTLFMLQKMKRISPDIVVLRNLHSNFICIPLLFKYLIKKQIKVVWVLHDCWGFTGFCTYYVKNNCYKWKTKCENCQFIRNYSGSWLFDTSSIMYKLKKRQFQSLNNIAVIGVSDWVANDARESFLHNSTIIDRIYNWIDLDVFKPHDTTKVRKEFGISSGDFVILGVAQHWAENKGLSYYIQVANKYPNYIILLVGKLDEEVPSNVISVGTINDTSELSNYYSMADVFLNFTQEETFGKVTAEALSCGTPVVINNNTSGPDLVGDCGVVIPNNDVESCFCALEEVEKNGKSSYSQRCRERAEALFNKEKQLGKYYELFDKLNAIKS